MKIFQRKNYDGMQCRGKDPMEDFAFLLSTWMDGGARLAGLFSPLLCSTRRVDCWILRFDG
jgi:hypothetical protein